MDTLRGKTALVTGGSRGIGLGIVEKLAQEGMKVTVVARDEARLAELSKRLGVATRSADVTQQAVAKSIVGEVKPDVLVLAAAIDPPMGSIDEVSWEDFTKVWNHDTKAGLYWIQEALKTPLVPGSRVIVMSSGACVKGSPMSMGYAGAKRMLWLMARYANGVSNEKKLGIHFQAVLPMQILNSGQGVHAAEVYAKKAGVSVEKFFERFGKMLTPEDVGAHVVTMLTKPEHADTDARGVKGDAGLIPLEG
jgi:NAD(P)-dependent dehydrogenase (short-subunit alcohol dehydrogenase family)